MIRILALRGDDEDADRDHVGAQRLPWASKAIPSIKAPWSGGTEDLALGEAAVLLNPQPGDAAAGGFHDVKTLLPRVQPDLVGEVEAVGDYPETPSS